MQRGRKAKLRKIAVRMYPGALTNIRERLEKDNDHRSRSALIRHAVNSFLRKEVTDWDRVVHALNKQNLKLRTLEERLDAYQFAYLRHMEYFFRLWPKVSEEESKAMEVRQKEMIAQFVEKFRMTRRANNTTVQQKPETAQAPELGSMRASDAKHEVRGDTSETLLEQTSHQDRHEDPIEPHGFDQMSTEEKLARSRIDRGFFLSLSEKVEPEARSVVAENEAYWTRDLDMRQEETELMYQPYRRCLDEELALLEQQYATAKRSKKKEVEIKLIQKREERDRISKYYDQMIEGYAKERVRIPQEALADAIKQKPELFALWGSLRKVGEDWDALDPRS